MEHKGVQQDLASAVQSLLVHLLGVSGEDLEIDTPTPTPRVLSLGYEKVSRKYMGSTVENS